jgi:flap endonuclease-1
MGIRNLNKFLKNNCPSVYEEIHISEFAFKKVGIDTSLYMCKFKAIYGQEKWITAFLNLVACLRRNEVHCVFIYDTCAPIDKAEERADRAEKREVLQKKVSDLESAIEKYYSTNEIDEILIDFHNKKIKKTSPIKSLLNTKAIDNKIDIEQIEEWLEATRRQILNITPEDFQLTKELFKILNVPFYQAPTEAEKFCSYLCRNNIIDAVLSEDTDVLAYGAPLFLSKIDTVKETCMMIKHEDILNELECDYNKFLDLCIMSGCDYNKNIYKVGPEKAFKYLQKYGSIEEIGKNTSHDISVLKHERVRELFTKYEDTDVVKIPYCGQPDFDILMNFIKSNNINTNCEYIKKSFIHNVVVFEEENIV